VSTRRASPQVLARRAARAMQRPPGVKALQLPRTTSARSSAVAGALVLAFIAIDAGVGVATPALVALRVLWASGLLAFSVVADRARERVALAAAQLVGPFCATMALALVALTGGARSGYFDFLVAFPFCMLVLQPERRSGALVASLVALGGGAVMLAVGGATGGELVQWVATCGGMGLLATYGSALYRRAWRHELDAERERARAVEELARSEAQRADAERLALVGRLAAGVAHEVNNPLACVKSNLAWLRDEVAGAAPRDGLSPELGDVLQESCEGVDRIRQIVNDLRDYARDGTDVLEDCAPGALVAEALRIARLRIGKATRVVVDVPPSLPAVRANHRRIVQALVNLLVDAADAVEARARSGGERGWIRLGTATDAGGLSLLVEDDGGVRDAATEARRLDPSPVTDAQRAAGLGLAISRENVARCGGTLDVEPGRAGGSRFRLRLPTGRATAADALAAAGAAGRYLSR
jgi:signal transduction histidine kinase